MQLLSHAHIDLRLNGHRFNGWAEDDPPYEWEIEDAVEFKEGQDGGLYGVSMPRLGGVLRLKLAPTSPSTQWCIQQEQLRKNALKQRTRLRTYAGTFADPVQGISYGLSGGAILMFPPTLVAGLTYEPAIRFEEITSEVDGGIFHAPLSSDAA